jgi:hypothetical protein
MFNKRRDKDEYEKCAALTGSKPSDISTLINSVHFKNVCLFFSFWNYSVGYGYLWHLPV